MEGVLIGTAILWGLTAVLVAPLTNMSVGRSMAAAGVRAASLDQLPEDKKKHWQGVATRHYIGWDVLVLGLAGLIGGLMGFQFIGISMEAKSWPGMIAFIALSFFGVATTGNL